MLEEQNGLCGICKLPVSLDEAVLDHCHKGGQVRAVLHRGCNSLLGKAENNAPRYGLKIDQLIAFLAGASDYIDNHRENRTGLVHPTHFTAEEKAERRKAKAKRERTKAKKLKQQAEAQKKLNDTPHPPPSKPIQDLS